MTRPSRLGALLLALALHTAGAQPAPARPTTIPLAPYGPAPMRTVAVTIADTTYDFLFDTGGGATIVSPAVAARLGCTPAGRSRGHRMTGEYLEAPVCRDVALAMGAHATRTEVAVMELKPYGDMAVPPVHGDRANGVVALALAPGQAVRTPVTAKRIIHDGVLSAGVLARAEWTIDLAAGHMWVGPVRPLLEPPAVAAALVSPPSADPTGWYDITLVVGGDRQHAVLRVERAGPGLTGRLRFVGDEKELALRDVRAHDTTLEFQLPMRQVYPVRLTFRALTGTGTWGDPATRGGAVEGTKRS